ncbi:serine arginine repetitive matrix 5-like protein [Labeo rohita]|uniref:Serine arginine repetitive matrix 5-like protein n=1 Tax=Labeo rohita TaxID=84645 RepID=A0A498MZ51_LABRO|nr:serine arginine repetitive matrix 5-like protein [Labeo rohita]RXN26675.1 serine arginine repetitive matrix 5-like protein [Labeo rohita]
MKPTGIVIEETKAFIRVLYKTDMADDQIVTPKMNQERTILLTEEKLKEEKLKEEKLKEEKLKEEKLKEENTQDTWSNLEWSHIQETQKQGGKWEIHLGYSSDRQLSLDLVNVGRQRLDFLPMLEHSGTYRESAVHSGTFAQEIITLVHQVKENYFRGQGITLNERFRNDQYYSLQDEFKEEEDEEVEMGNVRPVMNRQHGMPSSETQIFCKIGPDPLQRRQLVPDPGDLRYDLERRRLQRLEGVKITIAGGSFAPVAPEGYGLISVSVGCVFRPAFHVIAI